ncbi:hypothetical protein [Amycolatopsis sp.]|uniref:hypothetical protein n=1 Tax=Amycolatopsis sp. TaxID=37632 RepID=UPI002DFEB780|nr:hypothetical protein [Amycolatopsis sp.]
MSEREEGPQSSVWEPSETTDPNRATIRVEDISRVRRAGVLRACGAAWAHLQRRGLTSETVRDELQRCLRDAA